MFTKSVDSIIKVFTKAVEDLKVVEAEQVAIYDKSFLAAQQAADEAARAKEIRKNLEKLLV